MEIKESKILRKRIKIPLYFQNLVIIQTDDFKQIEEAYNLDKAPCGYDAITFEYGGDIVVVFNSKVTPSIIAHETVHIVSFIFHNIGAKKDIYNDEPEAYLYGYIVEQIHKIVKLKQ